MIQISPFSSGRPDWLWIALSHAESKAVRGAGAGTGLSVDIGYPRAKVSAAVAFDHLPALIAEAFVEHRGRELKCPRPDSNRHGPKAGRF